MSKNYIEIEGSALNLSLSGSTMNHSKINKPQAINKKPPSSYTNRSSLSSRSNSIVVSVILLEFFSHDIIRFEI
jgi:hypothetical protein